jgi:hypothetical protein
MPSHDASWARWAFLLALAASSAGCTSTRLAPQGGGTETGNPPVIDGSLVALVADGDGLRVRGERGAVSPGGSSLEVLVVSSGNSVQGRANADGSFDISLDASTFDTVELRAVNAGQTSLAVHVVRGAAAAAQDEQGLTCDQRSQLARTQLNAVAEAVDLSCMNDLDCTNADSASSCADSCDAYVVSLTGESQLAGAREAVQAGLCAEYEADGCQRLALPCAPPQLGVPRCFAGSCRAAPARTISCQTRSVCVVSEGAGGLTLSSREVDDFCTGELLPEGPSAGVYSVCLVNAQGETLLTTLGGSQSVEAQGLTHSGYGGGNIQSTLDADHEQLCAEARLLQAGAFSGQCD